MKLVRTLKFKLPPAVHRTAPGDRGGLHLSDIIKYILIKVDPKRFGRMDIDRATQLRWLAGFCWEDIFSKALYKQLHPKRPRKQKAILFRGVWMTPDFLHTAGSRKTIEETKFTWSSSNRGITDPFYRHYLWQVMGYCLAHETHRARLDVFYAMGDYRGSGPQAKSYEFRFSTSDLIRNWRMIERYKEPARRWLAKTRKEALAYVA